jgi:hypothetical protein
MHWLKCTPMFWLDIWWDIEKVNWDEGGLGGNAGYLIRVI